MITYDNGRQFAILLQLSGSVLPSCLPVGLFTFTIGLALTLIREYHPQAFDELFQLGGDYIDHPFALQTIAVVIGILLAMRTNMALGRWMDGISEVQQMLSKWADAYNALNGFFSGKKGDAETQERILLFRVRIAHWFSLMSCLAFATLRGGGQVESLEDVPIKELFDKGHHQKARSFTTTRVYGSFRRSRESADEFNNNKIRSQKQAEVHLMDLFVLAAPSAEEVSRLELATDKVNAVCLWIVQGIITEIRANVLDTPPPIVTRVFQELSNGMLGFNQAHKVAMVPFPFPFAQMVSLLLAMLYVTLPFYLDRFTQQAFLTPVICFLLPVCYSGLNTIAIELEEPFGMDSNDVDIEARHEDFLWCLVDVLQSPTIPPVSEQNFLEHKIVRCIAQGCPKFQEQMEADGLQVEWNDLWAQFAFKDTENAAQQPGTPDQCDSPRTSEVAPEGCAKMPPSVPDTAAH